MGSWVMWKHLKGRIAIRVVSKIIKEKGMNGKALFFICWRAIMMQVLLAGLCVFGIIAIAGVLFGWAYALLLGLMIVFVMTVAGMKK